MRRKYAPEALEETPHCVECGDKADGEIDEYDWAYFTKLSDARSYAESKSKEHSAVWLAEMGDYETANGSDVRSWFYHWGTKGADLPDSARRGKGVLTSDLSLLVDYKPLDNIDTNS